MEIRFLTSDDASQWWRLRLEALQSDPEAFSASAEEHQSLSLDEVKMRLGEGNAEQFVVGAFHDGHLRGMAGFYREKGIKSRHKARVWGVYLTKQSRGQGIGRHMMQTLLERGRSIEGVEQILISVSTTQTAAMDLYRSLGFQSFGREPRALRIGDRLIDEEYMVLLLTRGDQSTS